MKIYKFNFYGKEYNVTLKKATYVNNNTLAIEMFETTPKGKIKEPFGTVTINLNEDSYMADGEYQFVDTNNFGEQIVQWLIDNNIAKPTGLVGLSGFCSYPLCRFEKEALDEMEEWK